MKSEKAIISAKDYGSNTDLKSELTNELTMNKDTPNQNKFQFNSAQSRRDLLEQSKLSRLPQRTPFRLPDLPINKPVVVAVCAGCNARLDRDDNFQQSIQGCRKCIGIYTRIDAAIDEAAKRKKKEMLEKFAEGVNK